MPAASQCEQRYKGRTELATEYDDQVITLCELWEALLSHGLKRNRSLLKITKAIATKGLSRASVTGHTVTFWHFVRNFLNKHDHDRYLMLKNIHTGMQLLSATPLCNLSHLLSAILQTIHSFPVANKLLPSFLFVTQTWDGAGHGCEVL